MELVVTMAAGLWLACEQSHEPPNLESRPIRIQRLGSAFVAEDNK